MAASEAHGARVPELSQRPLAAGTRPLAVLAGVALGPSPSKLLEVLLHPPEDKDGRSLTSAVIKVGEGRSLVMFGAAVESSPYPVLLNGAQLLVSPENLQDSFSLLSLKQA